MSMITTELDYCFGTVPQRASLCVARTIRRGRRRRRIAAPFAQRGIILLLLLLLLFLLVAAAASPRIDTTARVEKGQQGLLRDARRVEGCDAGGN
jgi:hypothetical protein